LGSIIELPNKDTVYRYEYKCNSFSIYVRNAIVTRGFYYWGLPIIPIPVIPQSTNFDGLIFELNIEKNTAVTLPDEPLNIELRIPSTEQVLAPVKSGRITFDANVIKEWGRDLDGIDFRTKNPFLSGRTFLYKFDFINKDIKEFEIIFPSETLGCSIPKLTFKTKSKIIYNPIKVPWH
jgi:hypothetical protein